MNEKKEVTISATLLTKIDQYCSFACSERQSVTVTVGREIEKSGRQKKPMRL